MAAALVSMSLQTYSQVRGVAQGILTAMLKRHPNLAPGVLPTYLGVLSGRDSPAPAEAWQDPEAALQRCVATTVPVIGQASGQQQDISPAGDPRAAAADVLCPARAAAVRSCLPPKPSAVMPAATLPAVLSPACSAE